MVAKQIDRYLNVMFPCMNRFFVTKPQWMLKLKHPVATYLNCCNFILSTTKSADEDQKMAKSSTMTSQSFYSKRQLKIITFLHQVTSNETIKYKQYKIQTVSKGVENYSYAYIYKFSCLNKNKIKK